MKNLLLTALVMTINLFTAQAHITQVNTMEEVLSFFNEADSSTLAIFDVDMVLVQPSHPAFQMANMKRHSPIAKRIMHELPAAKQMIFLSLMSIGSEAILIDAHMPHYLQRIAQKGPVMALTANLTGELAFIKNMEAWNILRLRQLGIDFSSGAPYAHPLVFNELPAFRGNHSTYTQGILFVNGTACTKGEALSAFLQKTALAPKKIIFVDDREDNLKSVEAALQKHETPIQYQGLHYLGAKAYPSDILSEEQFETTWKTLAAQALEID